MDKYLKFKAILVNKMIKPKHGILVGHYKKSKNRNNLLNVGGLLCQWAKTHSATPRTMN